MLLLLLLLLMLSRTVFSHTQHTQHNTTHTSQPSPCSLGYCREEFAPHRRGFDTFNGYVNGAEHYFTHIRDPDRVKFKVHKATDPPLSVCVCV